ncbi:hypothetical protein C8A05DRAFT_20536 [Staphylotrichum tortipilum]|uniref:Uncharacterized protein n=1 Tax=Staphylotrichum tortipilum TaxID=2831512 RepID=A0AAN6RMX0_9PEZI|nr:hypothetical protein C8A05DRAFT_20536 [Staphylotrichum longicolle]
MSRQEPMECGHVDGCEIGYSSVRSYTIGWTANLAPVMWISGGFTVESSMETRTVHACPDNAYDYFAVWRKVGQTAYTVQNADLNVCTGTHPRSASSSCTGGFVVRVGRGWPV